MNQESFAFVVYMIHQCANHWHTTPAKVYAKLNEANCIRQYLVPHYEVLHTQSSQYLVDDIRKYLALRGVTV